MELWRVRLAPRVGAIPQPERLMEAVHRDYSPVCTPKEKPLVLSLSQGGFGYTFDLRHEGLGHRPE